VFEAAGRRAAQRVTADERESRRQRLGRFDDGLQVLLTDGMKRVMADDSAIGGQSDNGALARHDGERSASIILNRRRFSLVGKGGYYTTAHCPKAAAGGYKEWGAGAIAGPVADFRCVM